MHSLGKIQLSPVLYEGAEKVLEDGLKNLNSFHVNMPLYVEGDYLKSMNLKLLYYYHNRLLGYQLEDELKSKNQKTIQSTTSL
jgi:glycerol-3-phosphate O-acyltransferase